jgi:hypothetical protein
MASALFNQEFYENVTKGTPLDGLVWSEIAEQKNVVMYLLLDYIYETVISTHFILITFLILIDRYQTFQFRMMTNIPLSLSVISNLVLKSNLWSLTRQESFPRALQ